MRGLRVQSWRSMVRGRAVRDATAGVWKKPGGCSIPMRRAMRHDWIRRGPPVLSYGAFLLSVALGALYLTKWAVDVPYLDEWEALRSSQLPTGFNWHWLWAQHNEHRILPTNLEVLALYD